MGTKNNPGNYDCYENADPDEPLFILLGRDPLAASLVEVWAFCQASIGETPEKIEEAQQCAQNMRSWLNKLGKTEQDVRNFVGEVGL